jgi:catechol-2,3-dioxygenase
MSTANTPPLELHATILRVSDLEHSMEWYCNVFGLKPLNHDLSYRLATLVGENKQKIILRELKSGHAVVPSGLYSAYALFLSPDVVETHENFQQRGLKVSPVQDLPGVRIFYVYDPDDHQLCVLQFVIEWER